MRPSGRGYHCSHLLVLVTIVSFSSFNDQKKCAVEADAGVKLQVNKLLDLDRRDDLAGEVDEPAVKMFIRIRGGAFVSRDLECEAGQGPLLERQSRHFVGTPARHGPGRPGGHAASPPYSFP